MTAWMSDYPDPKTKWQDRSISTISRGHLLNQLAILKVLQWSKWCQKGLVMTMIQLRLLKNWKLEPIYSSLQYENTEKLSLQKWSVVRLETLYF